MINYKETLNLPKTSFKMKANLAQREINILKHWDDIDVYKKLRDLRRGKQKFILHDGPPYANGDIHLGHAINKTLKDFVIKSQSLNGYDAPYVPGWDCHGLPISIKVEQKIEKSGKKVTPFKFREACRKYALSQVNIQKKSFKRLGVFGDWNNPYLTMDAQYESAIIRSLAKIIDNGHLHRGFKPVYWCSKCRSALAEAEVEYKEKKSHAIDVRFYVVNEKKFLSHCKIIKKSTGKLSVPIWTTTPWTLPANKAVALNKKFEYVIVFCNTDIGVERLLVAQNLLESVMERYGVTDYEIVANCRGSDLEHLKLHHPFDKRTVPIILGDHVTLDAGTGAVHTAPGHGQDDYVAGIKYKLEVESPVDERGCFLSNAPFFAGKYVLNANEDVVSLLKARGMLLNLEIINHSYPHCWRHKSPLIFRATAQWFISMDNMHLREDALKEITKIEWIPSWGETRIANMVSSRPDWCISRQRTWGVPIAMFVNKKTGIPHPKNVELMEKVAVLVEKSGFEAWHLLDPKKLLGDEADKYEKVMDILDVWFESGASFACVLKPRFDLSSPADIYLEGSDQYRGWFQASLMVGCSMNEGAPFKQVLSHGFTVDKHGHKMSKSLGNVVPPEDIINKFGADVLRLWIASIDYTNDIVMSYDVMKNTVDIYRKIRNTSRFLLGNLNGFDPEQHIVEIDEMLVFDRWIVCQTRKLQEQLIEDYDAYRFHKIFQKIHHFCSIELGSFYLDVIKDRQYTMKTNSHGRRSAQTAMYHVVEALTRWISPALSFTADEIWQHIPGKREDSVFLTTWYTKIEKAKDNGKFDSLFWQKIIKVHDTVNHHIESLRKDGLLGSSLEAEVVLYADDGLKTLLDKLSDELRFVLITSSAKVKRLNEVSTNAVNTNIDGLMLDIGVSKYPKCIRCWHRRPEIGENEQHPDICGRCIDNVVGDGEVRLFC